MARRRSDGTGGWSRRGVLTAAGAAAALALGRAGPAWALADSLGPHPASPRSEGVKILILPFLGIPTTTGDAVYREIRARAPKSGVQLVLRLDEPASFRLRGYFSAVTTGSGTTIVFRMDLFDPSGRHVHQFSGQELAPTAFGDPWSGVDRKVTDHLAARIIELIKAWLTRQGA